MSIRKARALLALALYALAFVTAATRGSLARSAEMSGLTYDGTMDTIAIVSAVIIASALLGWNVAQEVYRNAVYRSMARSPFQYREWVDDADYNAYLDRHYNR